MIRTSRIVFDTSAFNWFKIRSPSVNPFRHSLSVPLDSTDGRGPPLSGKHLRLAVDTLVSQHIATPSVARRLADAGRIVVIEARSDGFYSQKGVILVDGHRVQDLVSSNYAVFKPAGVSGSDVSGMLPFPSMHFGYISGMERSTSGLQLLLNNVDVGARIDASKLPRVYSVTVSGRVPVNADKISKLHKAIPFLDLHITPFPLEPHERKPTVGPGSAYRFRITTRDGRPHLMRTLFASIGFGLTECRLESIGKLTLDHFNLESPKQFKLIQIQEIQSLLDA